MQQVIDGIENNDMRIKYDPLIRKIVPIKDLNGYMQVYGVQIKGTTFVSDRLYSVYFVGFYMENEDYILLGFDTEEMEFKEKGVKGNMYANCWLLQKISENVTRVTYYIKTDPLVKMIPKSVLMKFTRDGAMLPLLFAEYVESDKS